MYDKPDEVDGAIDATGVVVRKALRRSQLLPFLAKLPPCLVGI